LRVRFGERSAIDPRFAAFYLGHPQVREWIVRHAVGATMPNLNTSILSNVPFLLPPLKAQQFIADSLGSLDDKIELNRKMNETLEQMARAIFKSWFIDFDPVHAKRQGKKPFGMDDATAALFPDSFEQSELGEIPRGWSVVSASDLVVVTKGKSYKSEELVERSETGLVNLKCFARGGGYRPDGIKAFKGTCKPEQQVLPGEIVLSLTDVTQAAELIGRPALVEPDPRFTLFIASLDVAILRPTNHLHSRFFLFYTFASPRFTDHSFAHTSGTTVLHLGKNVFSTYKCILPSQSLIDAFDDVLRPIRALIQSNNAEARSLAATRDLLLPRLLSGEITIKEVVL
jgi:type I restriction enzyme S subunit